MIGALLYLRLVSLQNWLQRRISRLRQPKYLAGAIAGGAYIWFFFLRPTRFSAADVGSGNFRNLPLTTTLAMLGILALVRIIIAWIAPDKPGLGFSEAEIAFLFPAPITRRGLIHYKLLTSQTTIIFSTILVTVVARRWSTLGGNILTHAVGWWLLTSVLSLHNIGAAFTVARLNDRGVRPVLRQTIACVLIALYLGAFLYFFWQTGAGGANSPIDFLATPQPGAVGWLVLPFRLLLAPFFAPTAGGFARALVPALGILAAHYLWVFKSETSFEEASIAQAEKRARRVAALQAGRFPRGQAAESARPGPFRLDPAGGRPEVAFLWKNLLSTRSFFSLRNLGIAAAVIVGVSFALASGSAESRGVLRTVGPIAIVFGAYALLLGPQIARQDLRGDLLNADILKIYPLRGWQIMLGQLLTPAAILTGLVWLCLLAESLALGLGRARPIEPQFLVAAALAAAVLTPFICLLQLMIPNAAVLLFPSWAATTRVRERGIDVMGQRLLFVAGQVIVIVLTLIPALLCGALFGFAANWILPSALALALGAVIGLAILAAEIAGGLAWLGSRFEKFDVSVEQSP